MKMLPEAMVCSWSKAGLLMLAILSLGQRPAQGVTYANITGVTSRQLTNGVQITVQADGVLDYAPSDATGTALSRYYGNNYNGHASYIYLSFAGARSKLTSNYINVAEYPVSYVQVQVPQTAQEGVGILMTVALFTDSNFTVIQSPDQQSVIITVNSERTLVENHGRPAGGVAAATTGSSIELAPDGSVRIRAVDADIHELLAHLAHLAGLNIAVDDRVTRKVSLSLSGLKPDAVLQAVANGYGLALSKVDGVYMVSEGVPTDLATYHLSGTASFPMSYVEAQTASGLLPTFLFQYLHVNPGQNAVVVTAPDQMLAKIGSDLGKVDIRPPVIEIEALAVEFSDTRDLNESLGFNIHRGDRTTSFDTGSGLLQYQTIGKLPYSFNATLNALIQNGKAQIRANPRLAVVNGRTATLFIGDERYIQVQVNSYAGLQTKIEGVDVGTHLSVTPWTGGNGEITTHIVPEVSNISDIDLQSGLPILSDRKADTTVRVQDGDTIVIGGLEQKQQYVTNGKIPLLGDIPVLGQLFRSHKISTVHTELAIFITPHILDANGQRTNETPDLKQLEQNLLHSDEGDPGKPAPK